MLTGFWHGDSWNFIIWGLYYGIILLIEKFFFKDNKSKIYRVITIIIICIGWLIFRQTNFNDLVMSFKTLLGFNGFGSINSLYYLGIFSLRYILAFIVGIVCSFTNIKINDNKLMDILILVLFILSIISIVVSSYNPFIYFRF